MDEYILSLKNKFGYSEELLNFLKNLIPSLINYYGDEVKDVILSALSNCEIHIQSKDEDPNAFLNAYFDVDKKWQMPDLGGAFYHNEIKVENGQVVAKPIVYIKRVFLRNYIPFDFNNDTQVFTLIHEICHMIKGYGKLRIKDGKIIDSTGLMKDIYSYSEEKGVVEEKNEVVGIEEALTELETVKIFEMMTGKNIEPSGYKAACYSMAQVLKHSDIAKVFRISQFRGDDSWMEYLGDEQSKLLIENFDVLVKAMYVSFSDINTPEKMEALHQKMGMAQDAIEDFAVNFTSKENLDAFVQALQLADKKTIATLNLLEQSVDVNSVSVKS